MARGGCAIALHTVRQQRALCATPFRPALARAQLSLVFLLPTLLVWQRQLGAAVEYAEARSQAALWRGECVEAVVAPYGEVQQSQYGRVCVPALQAAGFWGWRVTVGLAAMFGYIAAVIRQQRGHWPEAASEAEM